MISKMSTVLESLKLDFLLASCVDMFVHSKRNYTVWPNVFEHIFRAGLVFLLDGGAYV